MKKIILSLFILAIVGRVTAQNELYNDGALIFIEDGALVHVEGEVINANSGTMENNGTIEVSGDFTNNATYQYSGSGARTVIFNGVGNTQNISGNMDGSAGTNDFHNLTIQKGAGEVVNLNGTDANVEGTLTFVNGIITTNAQEVYVTNNAVAAITGYQAPNLTGVYNNDQYVNGLLSREVAVGTYDYPIGDALNEYNPAVLNISSGAGKVSGAFATSNIGSVTQQSLQDCTAFPPGTNPQWIEFFCMSGEGYWDFDGPAMNFDITTHGNGLNLNGCGGPWYRTLQTSAAPSGHIWTNAEILGGTFCVGGYNYYAVPGTGYSAFGNFAQGSGPTGLPVELTYLHATPVDNTFILVDWETSVEVDNLGFQLQRSDDGITFNDLAWIDGAGNTTSPQYYPYNDYEVDANHMYYYRLKQVDFDGTYEFTPIAQAMITSDEVLEIGQLFPNPSADMSHIQITIGKDTDMNVEVLNTLGQVAMTQSLSLSEGKNTVSFDFEKLADATYQVVLTIDGQKYNRSLVITK